MIIHNLRSYCVRYSYAVLNRLFSSKRSSFILMFHHVTSSDVNVHHYSKCNIEHFEMVLLKLMKKGFAFVSMDDAVLQMRKGNTINYIALTFDDGIKNTFDEAYPILKRYNLPFTVYATIGYLNKEGYMTESQLIELSNDPLCTIGSHTFSHPVLVDSKDPKYEITQSKRKLESMLNKEILHFAYPYGYPNTISRKCKILVKKAGYHSAVSSLGSRLNRFTRIDRYYLPRYNGSIDLFFL